MDHHPSIIDHVLKNKPILFGFVIIVIVILIAIFSVGSPNPPSTPTIPSPSSNLSFVNLNDQKTRQAVEHRTEIADSLPINVPLFKASNGLESAITIQYLDSDPPGTVHLLITGISYLDPSVDNNPNATAYKESYAEAMRLMRDRDIDPTKLIFIYGDRDYVVRTAAAWISAFNLHP